MILYLLYFEYDDGFKLLQGIYDSREKAEKVDELLNGEWGTIEEFILNKTENLENSYCLSEQDKEKIRSIGSGIE